MMPMVATLKPYTLVIVNDEDAQNPRTENSNFGKMICFSRRHILGDKHEYRDKDDLLFSLLEETLGDTEIAEYKIKQILDSIDREIYRSNGAFNKAVDDETISMIEQKHIILPLYLYDHSGITMNTSGFSCPWDSGQVGWIYASHDDVEKEYGSKSDETLKKATDLLKGEVKTYDSYITNECYGFKLYKGKEEIDSCYGFIGDISEIKESIKGHLPDECKNIVESLEYKNNNVDTYKILELENDNSKELGFEL